MDKNIGYKPKYPLSSLSNCMEMLNYMSLCESNEGVTISEISKHFGFSKSSVHRMLDTLLTFDIVEKCPGVIKTYRIGWGSYGIGKNALKTHTVYNSNYVYSLEELSNQFDKSTAFSILDKKNPNNLKMQVLCRISPQSKTTLPYTDNTPLYTSSAGKLFMLNFSESEIQRYFQETNVKKYTENTILNYIDFLDELESIKKIGYSKDIGEYDKYTSTISMPIYDYKNIITACITIHDNHQNSYFPDTKTLQVLSSKCLELSEFLGFNTSKNSYGKFLSVKEQ